MNCCWLENKIDSGLVQYCLVIECWNIQVRLIWYVDSIQLLWVWVSRKLNDSWKVFFKTIRKNLRIKHSNYFRWMIFDGLIVDGFESYTWMMLTLMENWAVERNLKVVGDWFLEKLEKTKQLLDFMVERDCGVEETK